MLKRVGHHLLRLDSQVSCISKCNLTISSLALGRQILRRKPIKVIEPAQKPLIEPLENSYNDQDELLDIEDDPKLDTGGTKKKKKYQQIIENMSGNYYLPKFYELRDNKKFFSEVISSRNKKFCKRKGKFVLEGSRLINDAVKANVKLIKLYFSKIEKLKEIENLENLERAGVEFYKIRSNDLKLFSDLKTCPELMAVFQRPFNELDPEDEIDPEQSNAISLNPNSLPLYLIADNIRDPGNLGTMIRAAAGCGVKMIFCTKGCCDIWESKVVRATAGSIFRIPILTDQNWDDIKNYLNLKHEFFGVYLADSKADQTNHDKQMVSYDNITYANNLHEACALIVSGETGNSEEAVNFVNDFQGQKANIDMYNQVESLNTAVAASVIMYEIRRQLLSFKRNQENAD